MRIVLVDFDSSALEGDGLPLGWHCIQRSKFLWTEVLCRTSDNLLSEISLNSDTKEAQHTSIYEKLQVLFWSSKEWVLALDLTNSNLTILPSTITKKGKNTDPTGMAKSGS